MNVGEGKDFTSWKGSMIRKKCDSESAIMVRLGTSGGEKEWAGQYGYGGLAGSRSIGPSYRFSVVDKRTARMT